MDDPELSKRLLWLTGCILFGFGLVVLVGVVAARIQRRSARPLLTKYLAWFLLIPPILLPLIYSRTLFQLVLMLVSLQCIREFSRAAGLWTDRRLVWLCYLLTAGVYVPAFTGMYHLHLASPLATVALLLLVPVVRGHYEDMLQKVCLSILAVLYFGWFLAHLAFLRNVPYGASYAFYLLVLVGANDGFGYLWGKCLGRRSLTPRISPNKTVEGAVFGALSVLGLGYLIHGFLPGISTPAAMLMAALASVLGICGDLVVSFIKRDLAIKDMGGAIPGHGGLLDRCDSLILTAPAFFHVVRCFHAG